MKAAIQGYFSLSEDCRTKECDDILLHGWKESLQLYRAMFRCEDNKDWFGVAILSELETFPKEERLDILNPSSPI